MAVVCIVVVCKLAHIFGGTKDFWDVATAVGTVGATVAAVWIATRDDRRRSKEALATANVTAAALTWRLTLASLHTEQLLRRFDSMAEFDANPETFRIAYAKLDDVDVGSLEDVKAMIPLPNQCAFKLAAAQDRLKGLKSLLGKVLFNEEVLSISHERKRQAGHCAVILRELNGLIDFVQKESELASHSSITSGWHFPN
jgi:hypothetical protein